MECLKKCVPDVPKAKGAEMVRLLSAKGYSLSDTRAPIARAVQWAALDCGQPVLLEGPAAVGKTSLIAALAACRNPPRRLERVNNTDTTSVQDYFGSFLPVGKGRFKFSEGALTRALREGHWLLCDELNLAPVAVLAVLSPLLEGKREVYIHGKGESLRVHPEFRLFATQVRQRARNPAQAPARARLRVWRCPAPPMRVPAQVCCARGQQV